MKTWCVAQIDWSDNELILEIVKAEDWKGALLGHSKSMFKEFPDNIPSNLEDAKQSCFDMDGMMNCIVIS